MAFPAAGRVTNEAIMVRVRPLEETRTPNSGSVWLAECEVGGRRFEARSRHGAANALARELVASGMPDRSLDVHFEGLAGFLHWGSITAAAKRTYTEGNPLCSASDGSPRRMPSKLSERPQNRG